MVLYNLGNAAPGSQPRPRGSADEEVEDPLVGSFVWLRVDDDDEWALCKVEKRWAGKVHLLRQRHQRGTSPKIELMDSEFAKLPPAIVEGLNQLTPDLIELEVVEEYTMLHTLRERYEADMIYTSIGPVLVSINPYKPIDSCSQKALERLEKLMVDDRPPHVFSLAAMAYSNLIDNGEAQSIMISGESGAGKTEATKLCLSSLALVSQSSGELTEKALESAVLLESFGNAKTVYNTNSSRFGKWCIIFFTASGKMGSTMMETYLLEQSRIVAPSPGERNYHIFYHLLAGATEEERSLLQLKSGHDAYTYTRGDGVAPGIDDKALWTQVNSQLDLVGFSLVQRRTMHTLLSAVLAVGNITFKGEDDDKQCDVESVALSVASKLLGVNAAEFSHVMTTRQVIISATETIEAVQRNDQCRDTRDSIAKALYQALFAHVVDRINASLHAGEMEPGRYIGLLDIFGFENFKMNSFEQICINFTNERLQQLFIDCLVKREQAEYAREGVVCSQIVYPDNSPVVHLLDDKKLGVFAHLDDECNAPKGSEENFVSRMHVAYEQKPKLYSRPKFGAQAIGADLGKEMDKLQFVIHHFAESVQYTAYKWLDRNRNVLSPELRSLLASSDNPIVQMAFPAESSTAKVVTVSFAFRQSLRALSATVMQTYQHFIRCMKPNGTKLPNAFNGKFVARQMRYLGVHAVVEINRVGYPAKFLFRDFIRRYRCVAFDKPHLLSKELQDSVVCKNLMRAAVGDKIDGWFKDLEAQIGHTKVFMRHHLLIELEKPRRAARGKAAISVQKFARRQLARKVVAMVRLHVAKLAEVRASLDRLETEKSAEAIAKLLEESGSKLLELEALWETCTLPIGKGPLAWRARQTREQQAEQRVLEENLAKETAATSKLMSVLAKQSSNSKAAFQSLRLATNEARDAQTGLTKDLDDAIEKTEEAIHERFASLLTEWEAEVVRAVMAREDKRLAECKERERALASGKDPSFELVSIRLRNGIDPSSVTPKLLTGFTRSMGVVLNDMNAVDYLQGGGTAIVDGQLATGDIILSVEGTALNGERAANVIAAKNLSAVSLTIARSLVVTQGESSELPSGDFTGWLQLVRAKVTFKGLVAMHPVRKVGVVLQGSVVSLHEHQRKADTTERPYNLSGAVCKPYVRSKGKVTHPVQIVADMYARQLFPFKISWPKAEYGIELICGAATKVERAKWIKAVEEAIESAPLKGWLKKRQPEKSGISGKLFKPGWDRRWFELSQPQGELDASLTFYTDPTSTTPAGIVVLNQDSSVEASDKFVSKGVPHALHITSLVDPASKPIGTYLACETIADAEKWKSALRRAVRSFNRQKGPVVAMTLEEKELHSKSLQQLRLMLEYLGVDFDKKSEDKYKLCFLIVKNRELNKVARNQDKEAIMQQIRKDEARLAQRSVEELRQLLEYLEVEIDPELDDKQRLINLVISQKNLPAVTAALAPAIQRWRQRSRSSSVLDIS